jgi:hypothetical protein
MSEWLIWSNEHSAWWGPECRGYPRDIASAGKYTLEHAINICTSRTWTYGQVPPETMIHESCIPDSFARFHDDKPDERADRNVTTVSGDLDLAGRPMRPGS